MRQTILCLLSIVLVAGSATLANASILYNFESQSYGSFSSISSTVGGVTVTITERAGNPITVQGPLGPASWGAHSLLSDFWTATPPGMLANFSSPLSQVSIQFGDYDADDDTGILTAYSGLNGTGSVLGTASLFYPASKDIGNGDSAVGLLSVLAGGIQSIVFTSSGTFQDSVFWDNLAVTQGQIPEPAAFAIWGLAGIIGGGIGWWRCRKAA